MCECCGTLVTHRTGLPINYVIYAQHQSLLRLILFLFIQAIPLTLPILQPNCYYIAIERYLFLCNNIMSLSLQMKIAETRTNWTQSNALQCRITFSWQVQMTHCKTVVTSTDDILSDCCHKYRWHIVRLLSQVQMIHSKTVVTSTGCIVLEC